MISIFYPILEEQSGAEAHRKGLVSGFSEIDNVICRNQFSRKESVLFLLDAIMLGRTPYIRLNSRCLNFNVVVFILSFFRVKYILELNAPSSEDGSKTRFFEKCIRRASKVVCVSSTLKRHVAHLNSKVIVVANGGRHDVESAQPTSSHPHKGQFLFIHNSHWPWQESRGVISFAEQLAANDLGLKIIDVAGSINRAQLPKNVQISIGPLSPDEYVKELREAMGFYLEYRYLQDQNLGFYGDSLKFRDYWNTKKPIFISGPAMSWAPNSQDECHGVFEFDYDYDKISQLPVLEDRYSRTPYFWRDACRRILTKA